MNYFTPKRLICFAVAVAFMLVAARVGVKVIRDVQNWFWLRNAAVVDARILDYKHERSGQHRWTTFTYAYSFSGRMYQRSTSNLGPFVDSRAEARRIIAAAKHGLMVPCYVDASNPSNALLSRRPIPFFTVMWFVFPSVFAFAGASIFWGCISRRYAHQFK